MDARFLAFLSVSVLLILAPGPDMALVGRNALRYGRRAAAITALGVGAGTLGWGIAAVVGVAALLAQSADAFAVVKLAGAIYLAYLALHSLRDGLKPPREDPSRLSAPATLGQGSAFRQGVLGNLLNPKAAVIFVTIVPQFIRHGDSPLRLALMLLAFEVMIVAWLSLYGYLLARAGESSLGRRLRRGLQAVSGLVLMGFALRLAAER
jgi:threonine/homoserine/homoserine lactone efflux protein